MTIDCPKCHADISDTYERADPSVGIMCGGYYCQDCNISVSDSEVEREPLPDDVHISFARGPGERIGTPLSDLSNTPGTPGYEEFKRIARTWGYD